MRRIMFDMAQSFLECKLEERPSKIELVSRNILKEELSGWVAPSIQGVQQKLKFQRRVDELEVLLEQRPNLITLVGSNILKGFSVAPILQAAQQMLKFKTLMNLMSQKLEYRPSYSVLVDQNIIKAGTAVSSNIQRTQQALKFQTTIATIDHKLEHRPSAEDLVALHIIKDVAEILLYHHQVARRNFTDMVALLEPQFLHRPTLDDLVNQNILKGDSSTVAPSLHAAQFILSRNMSNNKLNHKLELRPSKVQIIEQNIMKDGLIATAVDRLNRLHVRDYLGGKIGERPDMAELVAHNVLTIQT